MIFSFVSTLQRYNIRRHRLGDGWRCCAIGELFSVIFLGFAKVFYDGFYLPWGKRLTGGLITGGLQLCRQLGAAVNPRHQVVNGCAWHTLGKVHQRQLFLGISPNGKCIHNF